MRLLLLPVVDLDEGLVVLVALLLGLQRASRRLHRQGLALELSAVLLLDSLLRSSGGVEVQVGVVLAVRAQLHDLGASEQVEDLLARRRLTEDGANEHNRRGVVRVRLGGRLGGGDVHRRAAHLLAVERVHGLLHGGGVLEEHQGVLATADLGARHLAGGGEGSGRVSDGALAPVLHVHTVRGAGGNGLLLNLGSSSCGGSGLGSGRGGLHRGGGLRRGGLSGSLGGGLSSGGSGLRGHNYE
mmetsp:Transcript_53652/g.61584  ORF Transcript_53652/g.61584 Transcript_53652/m.61584 type:complete len:242 (+) Transcript_53652:92-817(+)